MKKLFALGLLLALIGGVYAFYLFNKPVESLDRAKPELTISAQNLLNAYEASEESSNEKFLNKVIEVTGKVKEVQIHGDQTIVQLETDNPISSILCNLAEPLSETVQKGEAIHVKGFCTGYLMDVILTKCVIEN